MEQKNLRAELVKTAAWLGITLTICFVLSHGARLHWRLDLFSHFQLQYAIGAILLALFFVWARRWKLAVGMGVVFILVAVELFSFTALPAPPSAAPSFTIALYNRNVSPTEQSEVQAWLEKNKFDLVIIQEANDSIAALAYTLKELYPHQIHEPRSHAFGMVVFSRHPLQDIALHSFKESIFANFSLRLLLQPPGFSNPVAVHALHALPPMADKYWEQRNGELLNVARLVSGDTTSHRVMLGDWNITPYSPFFTDVLTVSHQQKPVGFPLSLPTWPAHGFPWLMQIPIDHILVSKNLHRGPLMRAKPANSDHYALVATIYENTPAH